MSCLICWLQGCQAIKCSLALLHEHLLHAQRGMSKLALRGKFSKEEAADAAQAAEAIVKSERALGQVVLSAGYNGEIKARSWMPPVPCMAAPFLPHRSSTSPCPLPDSLPAECGTRKVSVQTVFMLWQAAANMSRRPSGIESLDLLCGLPC